MTAETESNGVSAGIELRRLGPRLAVWLVVATVLLAPTSLAPSSWLLGDERIDVWNHAWGYWYVAQSLANGDLPLWTELSGAPAGGALYFIDTPSAVMWTPVTLLAGPAIAYNLAQLTKVALAGLAGQLLAEALGSSRRASWLGGVAMCTLPFLLCELNNGISEVCGLHWGTLSLWALTRLRTTRSWKHAGALGLFLGLTAVASFYFGLAIGLVVAGGLVLEFLGRLRHERASLPRLLQQGGASAGLSVGLTLPVWLGFRGSLSGSDALIQRPEEMTQGMLAHNAVDPRVYIAPFDFQSVDLAGLYGEPFVHTAYLRWTLLLLAGFALWRRRDLRDQLVLVGLSLVLGLGSLLWWGDGFVTVGGNLLSLPFGWLLAALPEVAITHPLRLSIGAQILVCGLAAVGLSDLLERLPKGAPALAGVAVALGLVAGEGMFGSAASWPLERSTAEIPEAYSALGDDVGFVLDLPAEVGTTMITSRYFWYQTAHGRPIPYVPDVRAGAMRDSDARMAVMDADMRRASETPAVPKGDGRQHLLDTYAGVVVHAALEQQAGLEGRYIRAMKVAFGQPTEDGEVKVWRMSEAGEGATPSSEPPTRRRPGKRP